MAISKLVLAPDASGYAFVDGTEVISVQLEGGAGRYRRDILNASSKVTVQWTVNREDYNYIRDFYKTTILSGSVPFILDLMLNDGFALTESLCYIVPGTFGLKSQSGYSFVLGCTLEVLQGASIPTPPPSDDNVLTLLFGDDWEVYNDKFDRVINFDFPGDYRP